MAVTNGTKGAPMDGKVVSKMQVSGGVWRDNLRWEDVVERYKKDKKSVSPLEIALAISKMNTSEEIAAGKFGRYWKWTVQYKYLLEFPEEIQKLFGPEFPLEHRLVVDDVTYIGRAKTKKERMRVAREYQKMRIKNRRQPFASSTVSDFDKA